MDVSTLPEMGKWVVETYRLSAFLSDLSHVNGDELFESCVGVPPESLNIQKIMGVESRAAAVDEVQVLLNTNKGGMPRFDVLIHNKGDDLMEPPGQRAALLEQIAAGLSAVPKIQRMAFGCAFQFPTESNEAAYKKVGELLTTVKVDLNTGSDLLYRINRFHDMEVPGFGALTINRIATWGCAIVKPIIIKPEGATALAEWASTRVETDINTAPKIDLSALVPEQKILIWRQMFEDSISMLKGDPV